MSTQLTSQADHVLVVRNKFIIYLYLENGIFLISYLIATGLTPQGPVSRLIKKVSTVKKQNLSFQLPASKISPRKIVDSSIQQKRLIDSYNRGKVYTFMNPSIKDLFKYFTIRCADTKNVS